MKEPKNNINIKSFLSNIDKINAGYFKNITKKRKNSIQKEIHINKVYPFEYSTNQNFSKNDNNYEINSFLTNNNNNNYIIHNKISLTKQKQNNFAHKRSFSKSIFNNINITNNNNYTLNKKNNTSLGGLNNNNSQEKNTPPLFINKNKGIILNKVNLFKNVKFKRPSLNNSNAYKNNSNMNSNNSNTNTVIQSLSSLNMTSTDITSSTKRKKENNIFITKENPNHIIINNNDNSNNINVNNFQINNITNLNNIIKNNSKQNRNKHFYNLTNLNKYTNTNTTYQYYKDILHNTNNIINKNKNLNPNNNIKNVGNKNLNKSAKKYNIKKDKRSISQNFFGNISKKNTINKKSKKKLTLNNIQNNNATKTLANNKSDGGGGTIISDDSVFNNSKRRSSSGTHNDSSKLSKGSGTISIDKKNKSISIDYTYSDDEIQTNRRKKMNKIQIEDENIDSKFNKISINNKIEDKKAILEKEIIPDINIDNLEFKNFCNDLSAKLFGNKI